MVKKDNVLQKKSFSFAVRVVKAYKYLVEKNRSVFFQNSFYGVAPPSEPMLKKQLERKAKQNFLPNYPLHIKKREKQIIGYDY